MWHSMSREPCYFLSAHCTDPFHFGAVADVSELFEARLLLVWKDLYTPTYVLGFLRRRIVAVQTNY